MSQKPKPKKRWNGEEPFEDRGAFTRREEAGLTTSAGTNIHPTQKEHKRTGAVQPYPAGHRFQPLTRRVDPTKGML